MRIEELELVCREAALNLLKRAERPLPATVVLPLADATRVVSMPDFPDADPERFDLLSRFAQEEIRPANAPCYGFIAEAVAESEDGAPTDVVVVVYGARNHHPKVTAAPLVGGQLGEFAEAEDLEPTAFPFLSPVQHAVDASDPPDVLPVIGQ